jgi:hypothetical protein
MFIPICLVGLILNIVAFTVYRSKEFNELPVWEYLRVYTINSALICLLISTQFLNKSYRSFAFSNSEWTVRYHIHFFLPMIHILTQYQSNLDILLSLDRIVLFTQFNLYKRLKPRVVCLFLFIFSFISMTLYWIYYDHKETVIELSQSDHYVIHHLKRSPLFSKCLVNITYIISDVIPLCTEIPLNVATIVLLKSHLKATTSIWVKKVSIKLNGDELCYKRLLQRVKKMETKITVLVILMSFVSIL